MNKKSNVIGIVAVLGVAAVLLNIPVRADAASSVTAVDSPYNLGATGKFKICVDTLTIINYAALYRPQPNNTLAWQTPPAWAVNIPPNGCYVIEPGKLGFGGFDMIGNWTFVANDSLGNQFVYEFTVSFLVVPESILGAITAVTAPLAAFTGYRILRQKRLN